MSTGTGLGGGPATRVGHRVAAARYLCVMGGAGAAARAAAVGPGGAQYLEAASAPAGTAAAGASAAVDAELPSEADSVAAGASGPAAGVRARWSVAVAEMHGERRYHPIAAPHPPGGAVAPGKSDVTARAATAAVAGAGQVKAEKKTEHLGDVQAGALPGQMVAADSVGEDRVDPDATAPEQATLRLCGGTSSNYSR